MADTLCWRCRAAQAAAVRFCPKCGADQQRPELPPAPEPTVVQPGASHGRMPRALRWTLVAAVIAALVFVVFRIFGGGMPVEVAAVRNGGVLQVTNVAEEKVTFQVAKKGSKGWSYVTIRGNSGKRVTLSPGKTWRRNLSKGQYQVVIGDERSDVVTLTR